MRIETTLAQAGNRRDKSTGAVVMPIYHSTTYSHPAMGQSTGYDYSRMANPTRTVLEETIAALEGGARGFAFASGMAAVHAVCSLFNAGDLILVSDDLYGGTYRLFEQVLKPLCIHAKYVDMANMDAVKEAFTASRVRAIFLETPTNPTMKITDISACASLAKAHGAMTIVDNTFMTPVCQRPIELGADIVLHSATKFLGGHNDVLAGLVVAADAQIGDKLAFYQNAIGAVLGPQDSWLLLRGMKTLALRMERHEENTRQVASWLESQPGVKKVYYPGLNAHPGKAVHERQSQGYGGMVSFDVVDARMIPYILDSVQLITFAESLGGVESLITYPATQTHADIPKAVRDAVGVTDTLLRLSVGLEHIEDLIADMDQAFALATEAVSRS